MQDTSLMRTLGSVPNCPRIDRYHCTSVCLSITKGCQALWMLGRKDELCRVVFAANVSNWFGGITKEMDYVSILPH